MKLWKHSTMTTFYGDGRAEGRSDCQVRLGDGRVAVLYDIEGGEHSYEGPEIGQGHFHLRAAAPDGEATLHCFPDSKILEGWWLEDGVVGMWRIELDDGADPS